MIGVVMANCFLAMALLMKLAVAAAAQLVFVYRR